MVVWLLGLMWPLRLAPERISILSKGYLKGGRGGGFWWGRYEACHGVRHRAFGRAFWKCCCIYEVMCWAHCWWALCYPFRSNWWFEIQLFRRLCGCPRRSNTRTYPRLTKECSRSPKSPAFGSRRIILSTTESSLLSKNRSPLEPNFTYCLRAILPFVFASQCGISA